MEAASIDYTSSTCVDDEILVNEVKKYEILYNKCAKDFLSKTARKPYWEKVYRVLFPEFDDLPDATQNIIDVTVRKRWKTLRDQLVRYIRVNSNYCYNHPKPAMRAISFLIGYVKETNYTIEHSDSNDNSNAYSNVDEPIVTYDSSLSYEIQDAISIKSERSSIEEYFDEGEKFQSQGVTIPEVNFYEEREFMSKRNFNDLQEEKSEQEEAYVSAKRSKLEIGEDINQTVLEILQQSSVNAKDEDRMFFLSLLSDFKRIPIKKKLQVKSKILTAIAEALD